MGERTARGVAAAVAVRRVSVASVRALACRTVPSVAVDACDDERRLMGACDDITSGSRADERNNGRSMAAAQTVESLDNERALADSSKEALVVGDVGE